MEFQAMLARALAVRDRYAELEEASYGRAWTGQEIALGFVGDVGDLAKLVMAECGVRAIPDARQKLAHELADCLWSVLVLSDKFEIDLEGAFVETMDDLEAYLAAAGA